MMCSAYKLNKQGDNKQPCCTPFSVLNDKEGRAPKNWCFRTVVLEKALESPLESKEIKSVNPKGNQPLILFGRSDAETEAPILWPPDVKSQLIGKDPDAGKDWKQEEKGATEDEMVGWHRQFNDHELGQTPGDDERQGGLECCSPWGCRESDTTWQLNNNNSSNPWLCSAHGEDMTSLCHFVCTQCRWRGRMHNKHSLIREM